MGCVKACLKYSKINFAKSSQIRVVFANLTVLPMFFEFKSSKFVVNDPKNVSYVKTYENRVCEEYCKTH